MRLVCFLSFVLFCAVAGAQSSYRTQFPLPASTSVTSWGVNADVNNLTVDDPSIQLIADAGAKFLRVDLKWANIEKTVGVYDFSYYDPLVSLCQSKGMRMILILDYANSLYNSGNAPSDDASRTAFVNFVTAAVTRYKGIGVIWEIWNEPNEDKFWKPAASVADYAALNLLVCQDIRSISPDEWIIGPGLSGFDWTFIEGCFQRGILQYWDAVSVHPYRSQLIPETALPDYDQLKNLIEKYRPAGRGISIIDSEWGYSLGWVNMDVDVQAKLDLRCKFVDMMSGTRTSITYSWRDQGSSTTPDNFSLFGLHDTNLVERASGTAYRVFSAALKGYGFKTRLDIGSPNDYCLLFASGTTCKLVAWTTAAAHNVVLPASAGSFAGSDMLGVPLTFSTLTPGLPVALTDRPMVLRATTSNALLRTISAWGRLASSGVAGDVSHLQKLVAPAIVSTSWQYAPAGTTMTVRDDPPSDQIFSLASSSTVIPSLVGLTMDSPYVQQALQADVRRIDLTEGARTLRITVTTPDGASATQSCLLYHPAPIRLVMMTPQNNQLTFRADNVSGLAFQGGVKAISNGHSADVSLAFANGELSKKFIVSAISKSDMQLGMQMEVLPSSVYAVGPGNMLPTAYTALVNRMPDPTATTYAATVEGDPSIVLGSTLTIASAPSGAGITGMKCIRLDYSFGVGVADIAMTTSGSVASAVWPGRTFSLGSWVYGDGSLNSIKCRFMDATGQVFDTPATTIDWKGWKFVSFSVLGPGSSFSGGAADGIVHGQVKIVAPAILLSQGGIASAGTVYVAGSTLVASSS